MRGNLAHGSGHMRLPLAHGRGNGTKPEELLGAALAECLSMVLALQLTNEGVTFKHIHTDEESMLRDYVMGLGYLN